MSVTHDQATALLIDLVGVRGNVCGDLSFQGGGEHPPGTVTHDLVDQRPARRRRDRPGHCRGIIRVHYGEHGRTFPTRIGARALLETFIGYPWEGTPSQGHPQVSSIALVTASLPSSAEWDASAERQPGHDMRPSEVLPNLP